jgi:hypothetical protein
MLPEVHRPDLIFAALDAGDVDYVVIGGVAAQAHGSATFTGDTDICYATDHDNMDRLGKVLVSLDARLRGVAEDVPFVLDGRTLRRVQVLTLDTKHGKFDVLAAPSGFPGYAALVERAITVEWAGATFKVASLEDLIAMKQAAGRPKDLIAVEELEAIQRLMREAD